ncbi:GTP pyrophosphokinase, partial [Streptococcus danieliae]|nr:GTP pyrophosphokinase [Streptococcus danieliae]
CYPWELQIWDAKDVDSNIQSHSLYKRNFVKHQS